MDKKKLICENCNKEFLRMINKYKSSYYKEPIKYFCSVVCRIQYIKSHSKSVKYEIMCSICNKTFLAFSKNATYCSATCQKQNQRKDTSLRRRRFLILQRDNFKCQYCGRCPSKHQVVLHIDHIIPRSKKGSSEEKNLITSCEDCNFGKGDIDYFGEK